MAYNNFIPTVWAEAINRELERTLVFAEDCNRQYEGKVKAQGDSVRILGVGKPTITTTSNRNPSLSTPETVADLSVTLPIDQISYFNYQVGDIDKHMAVGGVMEALNKEATQGVANAMDAFIANLSKASEAVNLDASAVQITTSNVLSKVDEALEKLWENDVTPNTKVTMVVPPWFYMIMKAAYTNLDTDNSEMVKNGRVGRYGGVIVKMSNNVAAYNDGTHDCNLIQIKTDKAIAFVNPMTHTEAYRPESSFSDAVKGFVLYGGKIVRPKELINLNVYK